jgi:hypothetical protein
VYFLASDARRHCGGAWRGVVNHAGARLLADLADVAGLSAAMSEALARRRQRDRKGGRIRNANAKRSGGSPLGVRDLVSRQPWRSSRAVSGDPQGRSSVRQTTAAALVPITEPAIASAG